MLFEHFVAQRFHHAENQEKGRGVSRPAVRVATFGIAIGLAVMIVSLAIVIGFKREVRKQVVGFGGHIHITNYQAEQGYDSSPITLSEADLQSVMAIDNIQSIQPITTKSGIIKTDSTFLGIVLKGVDSCYDWNFLQNNLLEGVLPNINDTASVVDALMSKTMANKLGLGTGDTFIAYFVDNHVRARKFHITGLYQTSFSAYDNIYLFTQSSTIRHLNGWNDKEVSYYELRVNDFNQLTETSLATHLLLGNRFTDDTPTYAIKNIAELMPSIFDWLELLDANAAIILILMLLVAGFNMISGLLILILERTNDIGLLKALGANNWQLRKIFLIHAAHLVGKGMLWGNALGLIIVGLQYFTHIIPLEAEIYYVDHVPVALPILYYIALNVGTAIASILMLLLPSHLVTKISPIQAMRFE